MRALHVLSTFAESYGGPVSACRDLCRELVRRGVEVTILTTTWDGYRNVPAEEMTPPPGVRLQAFPVRSPRGWWFSPELWRALAVEVRRHDVVHTHLLYAFPPSAAAIQAQRAGVPYVLQPHGCLDPYIRSRHPGRKRPHELLFERRNTKRAAAVLYTTEEERIRAGDFARQPGIVVPLGIDVPPPAIGGPRDEMLRRWPELRGKKVVLFLGRLHVKKGLDLLVRAFAPIARRRADATLVLAGPDDGAMPELREWLRAEQIESRVLFTGMLRGEDKTAALRGADVFVLASYAENFAIAVAEAMAESRPVVISDQVYIWREVAEADAGLVVRCDAGELEQALDGLLRDDARADRMGRNGRRLVTKRFHWNEIADRVIDVYHRAVNGTLRDLGSTSPLDRSIGSATG